MKKFLLIFFALTLPNSVRSQTILMQGTQQAVEKAKEQMQKAKEKVMEPIRNPQAAFSYWFDFDPKIEKGEKKNFNVLPLILSSPEKGFGLGVKFAEESILKKGDVIGAQAIHTVKNRSEYRLKYQFREVDRIGGAFEIGYANYDQFYYGMGNLTPQENETDYVPEIFDVRMPLLYHLTEKYFLGFSLNYENFKIVEIGQNGILRQELPGLIGNDGSRLYTTTLSLRRDTRDSKTNPRTGNFFEANQEYSKKLLGSAHDFTRTTLESRHFLPLDEAKKHVFALRFFMDYKTGDVPFYHLPQLGGLFFNRGLVEGRFRDTLSIFGNWEYRLKIYQRMHWAFFVDAGNVFHEFHTVTFKDTKFTGGTGMRYFVPPGNLLLARIDGGYSTEGFNVYLTFDQPF